MAARRRILFICFVNALVFSKFDDLRNTAYGAREGESKSLPRGEGFRERVTCTQKCVGLAAFRRLIALKLALALSKFDNLLNY